jgi:hypothetical protein
MLSVSLQCSTTSSLYVSHLVHVYMVASRVALGACRSAFRIRRNALKAKVMDGCLEFDSVSTKCRISRSLKGYWKLAYESYPRSGVSLANIHWI